MSGAEFAPLNGVELRPTGGLVERALARLTQGPASTTTLAAEVLALRGNPQAAAAAVFALLGSDARFHVDATGTWSLRDSAPSTSPSLRLQEWVVVDVETTGGSPAHGHRVIEVAAVHVSGGEIQGSFTTLVNPGCPIPRMITSITGIDSRMVAGAPRFEAVAPRIADTLTGRVFVGHNAAFDWRFVSSEMERWSGRALSGRQLCTLRIARRLLPHLPSRSLGSLAEYFGIRMEAHHRALDDALATARLLLHFLDDLEEQGVTDWPGLDEFFRSPARRRAARSAMPRSMDAS